MTSDSSPQKLSDSDLHAFFNNPINYIGVNIDDIIAKLGPPTGYDDWDWGRFVYDWQSLNCRYSIVTRGGYVKAVEELDARDSSRFGTTVRLIWGDTGP